MKSFFLIASFSLITVSVFSQDVFGYWKTIDDNTGETKSVVHIYKNDEGKTEGKVIEVLPRPGVDPEVKCTECPKDDPRHGQKVAGMVIMSDMKKDGDEYCCGEIMDPENGNSYRCKIWTDGKEKLKVRGYLGPFFRTQTWMREDNYSK
ncbi:MAG: DUF2147 domain-containing protein [Bacteroidota bacterium]